jgi:hypothetical protein
MITAPAGLGKTTLVNEWIDCNSWLKTFAVRAGAYALENGHANFIGWQPGIRHPDFAKKY